MSLDHLPRLDSSYALTDEQIQQFRRDGHVRLREVADEDEVRAFRDHIADAVIRLSTEQRPLSARDTYAQAFIQVFNLWQHDDAVAAFTLAPRFAQLAAELLGAERVRLYHDQALFKEPGGGYTPWHQDAMYWPIDGARCLTMWMPLVEITPGRGGLCFASGSHIDGPLSDVGISDASEELFDQLISERDLHIDQPAAMMAGDASFHAGWTVHKALPNESDAMREVMTVIWYADGLAIQPPTNSAQENDLKKWLPGLAPGEAAASPLNPVLPSDDCTRTRAASQT
jgi:ectoine hydroxylase-related dioxygenase (phytanoyl-CoA dioxygenase family)